jgi:hypothetical protein
LPKNLFDQLFCLCPKHRFGAPKLLIWSVNLTQSYPLKKSKKKIEDYFYDFGFITITGVKENSIIQGVKIYLLEFHFKVIEFIFNKLFIYGIPLENTVLSTNIKIQN